MRSRADNGKPKRSIMERLAEVGRSATDEADLSFCLTAQKEEGWQQSNNKKYLGGMYYVNRTSLFTEVHDERG